MAPALPQNPAQRLGIGDIADRGARHRRHGAVRAFNRRGHELPADHDGQLYIQLDDGTDFFGHVREHIGTDAEALITHQGFATEFEQYAFIFGCHAYSAPIWNLANRLMVIFSPVLAITSLR